MPTNTTKLRGLVIGAAAVAAATIGCESPPRVERVPVAAPGNPDARVEYARPKPLPDNARLYDRDHEYAPQPPPRDDRRPAPAPEKPATDPK